MTARTPTHRAVRRALAAAVTVGVALVALVATLTTLVSSASHPAAADSGSAAVPAYLSVPQNDEEAPVAESLAVGPQAVVMAVDREDERGVQVIGVGAESGAYRVLELPGRLGTDGHSLIGSADADTLALSADGTRLAYPRAVAGDGPDALTGVGIVDLVSGDVRTVPIDQGHGVRLVGLSFSPDAQWVVWWGNPVRDWQRRGEAAFANRTVAGRVAPGSDVSEPVPGHRSEGGATYAVADDGTVAIAELLEVRTWDGRVLESTPAARGIPESTTTDGTDVTHARTTRTTAFHQTARTPPWVPLPAPLRSAMVTVHDWVDLDHAVVTVDPELGVLALDGSEPAYVGLVQLDYVPEVLTVATDLLAGEPQVTERPRPEFVAEREDGSGGSDGGAARWWVGGGVLAGALAIALLLRRRRRRT
ncbi:hypothetical protein [Nocardioides ferulae]|uniref:hypothetical protein n=1 Tax=Nocardioides ferulae TaxID=2340821 RepID=UPI000EB0C9B6|nr:hypothetical protein [Nocardioides ferulae]